jgi:hypothetical protein
VDGETMKNVDEISNSVMNSSGYQGKNIGTFSKTLYENSGMLNSSNELLLSSSPLTPVSFNSLSSKSFLSFSQSSSPFNAVTPNTTNAFSFPYCQKSDLIQSYYQSSETVDTNSTENREPLLLSSPDTGVSFPVSRKCDLNSQTPFESQLKTLVNPNSSSEINNISSSSIKINEINESKENSENEVNINTNQSKLSHQIPLRAPSPPPTNSSYTRSFSISTESKSPVSDGSISVSSSLSSFSSRSSYISVSSSSSVMHPRDLDKSPTSVHSNHSLMINNIQTMNTHNDLKKEGGSSISLCLSSPVSVGAERKMNIDNTECISNVKIQTNIISKNINNTPVIPSKSEEKHEQQTSQQQQQQKKAFKPAAIGREEEKGTTTTSSSCYSSPLEIQGKVASHNHAKKHHHHHPQSQGFVNEKSILNENIIPSPLLSHQQQPQINTGTPVIINNNNNNNNNIQTNANNSQPALINNGESNNSGPVSHLVQQLPRIIVVNPMGQILYESYASAAYIANAANGIDGNNIISVHNLTTPLVNPIQPNGSSSLNPQVHLASQSPQVVFPTHLSPQTPLSFPSSSLSHVQVNNSSPNNVVVSSPSLGSNYLSTPASPNVVGNKMMKQLVIRNSSLPSFPSPSHPAPSPPSSFMSPQVCPSSFPSPLYDASTFPSPSPASLSPNSPSGYPGGEIMKGRIPPINLPEVENRIGGMDVFVRSLRFGVVCLDAVWII